MQLYTSQFSILMEKGRCVVKNENIELTLRNIEKMIQTIKYGSITLVVHDKQIVQIDKNEKIRIK